MLELKEYLRQRFFRDNHKKYHKYFNEWFVNLTSIQLMYFEKEQNNVLTENLVKH